jgi:hypothetical protein
MRGGECAFLKSTELIWTLQEGNIAYANQFIHLHRPRLQDQNSFWSSNFNFFEAS